MRDAGTGKAGPPSPADAAPAPRGALWFTGLPGAGKSTVCDAVEERLKALGVALERVSMDQVRDVLTPEPDYTEAERARAYDALVMLAGLLARHTLVLVDATAHRRRWRDALRERVEADIGPDAYVEVHVDCPLEVAMEREAARTDHPAVADLYRRALERLRGEADHPDLGDVIGVDVEYEAPKAPEVRVASEEVGPKEAAERVLVALREAGLLARSDPDA